jgi:3-phenylpropionate/trans-cinnamate dioxygenase ferredoxin reductase subunit
VIAIVGTGLAAIRAAKSLRDAGSSAPIVMLGAERARPYDRSPLSKEFLRGDTTLEDARIHGEEFFREAASSSSSAQRQARCTMLAITAFDGDVV